MGFHYRNFVGSTFAAAILATSPLLLSCTSINASQNATETVDVSPEPVDATSDSFDEGFNKLLNSIEEADYESVLYRDAIYGYEDTFWKLGIEYQDNGGLLSVYFIEAGERGLISFVKEANDVWASKPFVRNLRVANFSDYEKRGILEEIREVAVDHYEAWTDMGLAFESAAQDWWLSWLRPGTVGFVYATVERARAPFEASIESTWRDLCGLLVASQPQSNTTFRFEQRIGNLCSQ